MQRLFFDKKKEMKKELISGIAVMAAMSFMLCIYAPLELYCYNQREFWFDVYDLLPLILVMFLAAFAASSLVMTVIWLVSTRLYLVVLPASVVVFVSTYIQGNFLVGNLPPMDGRDINWADYSAGRIHSIVLWMAVILVVCVGYRLLRRDRFVVWTGRISLGMMLMLIITLVSIVLTTKGYERKLDACATVKNEYVFSEDENFIILLLDATDAATLSGILEEQPEYRDIFQDFTYYANTLGAYPCTMCAIPQILSGEWFQNETGFDEYNVNVYKNAKLFANLEERGYAMGMYMYDTPYLDESIFRFDNVLPRKSEINSYLEFAKCEIKLVGLRYAPYDLKKKCVFWANPFKDLWKTNDEYEPFTLLNNTFYERMKRTEIEKTAEKRFKFIHIEGSHVPFIYDEDVNVIEDGDYIQNIEASLTITDTYLKKLKDAGVYDNSVIIIMADHGLDGEKYGEYTGRQNPILFIKGKGEQHALTVSQAPVSFDDLQEAFARLLEGAGSDEVFDCKEGDERTRRYLFYEYEQDEHMVEYVTTGHASEDDKLTATGKEYILEK